MGDNMVSDITMNNMQPGGMPEDDNMHVVMFFGSTCGPCKATMPFYEEVAAFYTEKNAKIKFHRIDAWNPPEQREYCTLTWGVSGVPHFNIFYGGQVLQTRSGGGDFDALHTFVHEGVTSAFKKFGARI
jgi:thiol-disulfide isomerase/thioredoxin